jgi:hypothetical protein
MAELTAVGSMYDFGAQAAINFTIPIALKIPVTGKP